MNPNITANLMIAIALATASPLVVGASNLVPNGAFEDGNINFESSYQYAPAANTNEGQYTLRTGPPPWNIFFVPASDHTGNGTMFLANGSPTNGAVVWQSDVISVNGATNYFFEAWVMNVCCTSGYVGPNSASILEFSINGVAVGTKSTNLGNAGSWEGLSTTWNSGVATTAVLRLINRNTAIGGNDFAVDDISLSTVSSVPEPASIFLMLAGLSIMRRFESRRKSAEQSNRLAGNVEH